MPLTSSRVSIEGTRLPAKLMTAEPDCRIPTMTMEQDKRTLTVLAPRKAAPMTGCVGTDDKGACDRYLAPYLQVVLDESVDLDRSTLSLHGGD
eukprot:CAMPEP_0202087596 /NCGR_PEP_ID=MMETSP0964-20121228/36583_1 /ASSEMBLY_ACC=CAM_ASM_000500 /TAXON_ID=4773 /ORGANISM="Schizochytrium aggregatum, Strain ATCC28209" /LENGTH=92 /DNA_ID=CAMNT_0048655565 /DNA_START=1 /DNA_END=276 /DNA_ORIENTATION=+